MRKFLEIHPEHLVAGIGAGWIVLLAITAVFAFFHECI